MPVRVVPFTPDLLPAVTRFSRRTWARPEDDGYFRWRYLDGPNQVGHLAMDGDECVAMVWAFLHAYRIADRTTACLETCDWFSRPGAPGSLHGVRVLRALMQRPEPIVAVGGSRHTLGLLPRLGWRRVGETTRYVLPLGGASVGRSLERRLRVPAGMTAGIFRAAAGGWFAGGPRPRPAGGRVAPVTAVDPGIEQLYDGDAGHALLPIADPAFLRWLMAAPASLGQVIVLEFSIEGRPIGWSLARVYENGGVREASIIELYAHGGEERYAWLIAETVAALRAGAPDTIFGAASDPEVRRAFRRQRFLAHRRLPIHVWPPTQSFPELPHHLGHNNSDVPVFPYPTERSDHD